MANRAAIGNRTSPTTVSDGSLETQVTKVIYNYASSGGSYFITQAFIELLENPGGFSGDITITMPDGSTYVEDDYLQVISGSTNAFNAGGGSTQVNAPFVRLDDYGETAYSNTPIIIGGPEGQGLFISGLDTSSGSGTSASPYAAANVLGTSNTGQLENTTFDSGAHIGAGLQVYKVYQGVISTSNTTFFNGNRGHGGTTINHNWGDRNGITSSSTLPQYALRFSRDTGSSYGSFPTHRSMAIRPRQGTLQSGSQGTIIEAGISNNSEANAAVFETPAYGTTSPHFYQVANYGWLQVDFKIEDFDIEQTSVGSVSNIIASQGNGYHVYAYKGSNCSSSVTFQNAHFSRTATTQGTVGSFNVQLSGAPTNGSIFYEFYIAMRRNNGTNGGAGDTAGVIYVKGNVYPIGGQIPFVYGSSKSEKSAVVTYMPWKEESSFLNGFTGDETIRHFKFSANTAASNNNSLQLEAVFKDVFYDYAYNGASNPTITTTGRSENFYYALVVFYEENFKNGESI